MINAFIPIIASAVEKVVGLIPDEKSRNEAKAKIEAELITAANAALQAQLEINKTEAIHKSLFVAGWRPFIGWICGLSIFWAFLGQPLLGWVMLVNGIETLPPAIATERLFELVLAMLGIGGLRTFEKLKGVARER